MVQISKKDVILQPEKGSENPERTEQIEILWEEHLNIARQES